MYIGDKDLFRFAFLFLREPLYMSPYYPGWAVMNNTGVRDSIVQYYEEYDSTVGGTSSMHTDTHTSSTSGGVGGGGGGAGGSGDSTSSAASYTTTGGKKIIPYFFHQLKHRSPEAFKYVIKGHNSEDLLSSACIPCDTEITSKYFIEKNNKRKLRGNLAENKHRMLSSSSNTIATTAMKSTISNNTSHVINASKTATITTPPMPPSPRTAAAHSTESLPTTTTATATTATADIASTATTTASTTAAATALVKVEHSVSPLAVYPLTSPIPSQADFYIKFTAKVLDKLHYTSIDVYSMPCILSFAHKAHI